MSEDKLLLLAIGVLILGGLVVAGAIQLIRTKHPYLGYSLLIFILLSTHFGF